MTTYLADKYKVIQKIGEGSFSEVIKCEDIKTGTQYAAKRLKKLFKNPRDVLYCAEVIATNKIARHPNILYMVEFHYDPLASKVSFIFELMDMSVYDFMQLKKRCIPETRARNYLYQILKGLDHLHKNGLFHRDIKPENILIKLQDNPHKPEIVKLADLGSIRGIYSKPPYTEYISTRWYRSPECLLTMGYYGPKMDVWATGCVFYEMLRLKPLFPGTNEIDQLAKIHSILGTPSSRTLLKFKKKSRNFMNFPKRVGTGLEPLLLNMTPDCQSVLKLMIQYDPDVRTNVRRLLDHNYFISLRTEDELNNFRQRVCATDSFNKSKGDFKSLSLVSQSLSNTSKTKNKFKTTLSKVNNVTGNCAFKGSRTLWNIIKSKTSTDISSHSSTDKAKNLYGNKNLPNLSKPNLMPWAIYTNSLETKTEQDKQKITIASSNKKEYVICKQLAQQKVSSLINEKFRKTTSCLPQMKKLPDGNKVKSPKQYQSKSFVLSRQIDRSKQPSAVKKLPTPKVKRSVILKKDKK